MAPSWSGDTAIRSIKPTNPIKEIYVFWFFDYFSKPAQVTSPIKHKKYPLGGGISEATTGFEPVIRVLQTLAFPLGHVA